MPDRSPKFRTPLACRLAGIDRGWFNSAVAKGQYLCAPPARGNTRIFTVDDVVSLYLFGHFTRHYVGLARAGELACDAVQRAKEAKVDRVVFVASANGASGIVAPADYDPDSPDSRYIVTAEVIHIANVRAVIMERWDQESQIYGEEEGE